MSFRLLTSRLANHGRYFLQCFWKRGINTNVLEQTINKRKPTNFVKAEGQTNQEALKQVHQNSGIFRFGQHARKLFIDSVLSRETLSNSTQIRNEVKRKLYGDRAPIFALIGVTLASSKGILTKEDELDGVCCEIREATLRLQNLWTNESISNLIDKDFNIDKLDVGPPIAKGCSAVVYLAALKPEAISIKSTPENCHDKVERKPMNNIHSPTISIRSEISSIQNMSRFIHKFRGNVDNLYEFLERSNDVGKLLESKMNPFDGLGDIKSFAWTNDPKVQTFNPNDKIDRVRYPLAMKMMFNYDIQSNSMAIYRAMYKETVPARKQVEDLDLEEWEKSIKNQTQTLPPHPNIVLMFGYFCGEVKNFIDGHILYPFAQPQHINPHGYGRNMSLYLLMKRYDCSLKKFLQDSEINLRKRLLLFAQLLEAITHLNINGIAHRDIKSDNILIEINDDYTGPLLVLSDFGCCLSDKIGGLKISYTSHEIDKGGNSALMAPEIINKKPGTFSVLNYSKSDLWACGAIAYEIFGMQNPFYSNDVYQPNIKQSKNLNNSFYTKEELPDLSNKCPIIVKELIYNILNPKPNKRLSPDIAANVMQIFLWAPTKWLNRRELPSNADVLQWLLTLTMKVMREESNEKKNLNLSHNDRNIEYLLICSFLSRVRLNRIRNAISWIQDVV